MCVCVSCVFIGVNLCVLGCGLVFYVSVTHSLMHHAHADTHFLSFSMEIYFVCV